ncbi:MAG: aminopeptidase P family protein, partial [Erysipelotrichia bacterium]|nr:aminopeptidase P family protein [Erysipelotrichia bacterium]
MKVSERISAVRELMKEKKIDVYYVPNEDDHLSEEYTADYFKCKSWLSGFSGEAGCTVVTEDFAGLWTDGRYFTQAEDELKGTGVKLMRLRQPGVPDPLQYLIDATPANGVLGFDGRVMSTANVRMLANALKKKNASIVLSEDLAGQVWGKDRPKMPEEKLYILEKKYTGEDAKTRIARVREVMKANNADALVLTALEDPCWLLNVRGNDIACTPVAYAFAVVTEKKVSYYIDRQKLTPVIKTYLKNQGVTVRPYDALADDLMGFRDQVIWADLGKLNADLYAHLDTSNSILNEKSPVELFRAVKNSAEIRATKNAHIKDGTAMVKFIFWVKQNAAKGNMTELSAQNKIYELRAAEKDYIEPSFHTIAAYQANGAMMHYSVDENHYSAVKPEGFLLV